MTNIENPGGRAERVAGRRASARVMLYEAPGADASGGEGLLAIIREGDDRAVVGMEDVRTPESFIGDATELAYFEGHPLWDYAQMRYHVEWVVQVVPASFSDDGATLQWRYTPEDSEDIGRLIAVYEHDSGRMRVVGEALGEQARTYLDTEGWELPSPRAGKRHDDPGKDDR